MTRRAALAACLALAACAPRLAPVSPLRDLTQPVYSTASFDPARLAGRWRQVAEVAQGPGCGPGGMEVTQGPGGLEASWNLCLGGRPASGAGGLRTAGPGRFLLPGLDLPVWVLWADADNRTLVLGTPSGGFGLVLDRTEIPADRAKAAREILAWNGYDTGLLRDTPR